MDIPVDDLESAKSHWQEAIQDIIMIAPQVNDIRPLFLNLLQDMTDKARVLAVPAPIPAKRPPIDDVTVENEAIRLGVLQEVIDLVHLAVGRTKVDIREDDRLEPENSLFWLFHGQAERAAWICGRVEISSRY